MDCDKNASLGLENTIIASGLIVCALVKNNKCSPTSDSLYFYKGKATYGAFLFVSSFGCVCFYIYKASVSKDS